MAETSASVLGGTESLVDEDGEGKVEPLPVPPVCKGTSSSEAISQTETDEEKGYVYGSMCVRVCYVYSLNIAIKW